MTIDVFSTRLGLVLLLAASLYIADTSAFNINLSWTIDRHNSRSYQPRIRTFNTRRKHTLFADVLVMERPLLMYNSKSRKKEVFQPNNKDTVTMYTCGPTVYDSAHLGNFRAFLTYDLLKRVLLYLGYDIRHVCNITDIDDKIIKRANEQNIAIGNISSLTERYEKAFLDDLKSLNCLPATVYPRATEHVAVMIRFVQELANKGLAYETADGSWYFDTQKLPTYGTQLVELNYEEMMEQKETENSDRKNHFADFCLWKAYKNDADRADAVWDSSMFVAKDTRVESDTVSLNPEECKKNQPWPLVEPAIKLGRPGWHLECSAMARTYFGKQTLDFHGGGIDLKFPHHENEIAQSEGLLDRPFCNCWFHNGFVNMDDEKMSKSLGNFVTVSDACPTSSDKRAYRYLVISSQYRNPLQFTKAALDASKHAIRRMDKLLKAIDKMTESTLDKPMNDESKLQNEISSSMESFEMSIRDDLSMPRASAALFAIIKAAEQEMKRSAASDGNDDASVDIRGLQRARDAIRKMDQIFGVFYSIDEDNDKEQHQDTIISVPENVMKLVDQRVAAKNSKDWELADSLRQRVTELGFAIKDVKDGDPIITPIEV